MSEYRIEITKDEYDELIIMSYAKREEIVYNKLPQEIVCGYGYYGHYLNFNPCDNKFYIICNIGLTCE